MSEKEYKVTVLPEATREEQMKRWGLKPERTGAVPARSRRWALVDDAIVDGVWDYPDQAERELEEHGFIVDGGWQVANVSEGGSRSGGMTSHRGILHPDEYVDAFELQALVEEELGFTYEQIRSVYRQGPLSADQRELRAEIDARLLALSLSGGNMLELGKALGFEIKGRNCRMIDNALARARSV